MQLPKMSEESGTDLSGLALIAKTSPRVLVSAVCCVKVRIFVAK